LGTFIPKITNFGDFGGCKPIFLKVTMVKFGTRVRICESLLQAKFYKNRLRGIPFWANLYQKLPISAILGAVSQHFKVTMVKFGRRVRAWESLPHAKFCRNCLRIL